MNGSIMRWLFTLPLRMRSLFRGAEVEQELDDELRDHIERQTAANIAAGMPADAARTAALRAFGGIERRKEEVRETREASRSSRTSCTTSDTRCESSGRTRYSPPSQFSRWHSVSA